MALQPKKIKHDGSYDLNQLETNLNLCEAVRRLLTEIKAVGGFTVSTHDNQTAVPANSLKLLLDPNGDVKRDGKDPFVRGSALIGGQEKKVACFRL